MITPAMDGFLLKCAEEAGIRMEDYGYSSQLTTFTSITKSITSKNDANFKKLFKALKDVPEIQILKRWLKYLKENKHQCKEEELKNLTEIPPFIW